jgi:lysozyme
MIDVSNRQGAIDWAKVKASGVERAYLKATEGVSFHDGTLLRNTQQARQAGVQVGFYHFAHPSNSPLQEARFFLAIARNLIRAGDMPPALDLELAEGHDVAYLNGWKSQWLAAVDAAVPCDRPHSTVFYSYYYFWKTMVLYPERPVWGAGYGAGFAPPPAWSIWQYSSTGHVPGINGYVDLDKPLKPLPTVTLNT